MAEQRMVTGYVKLWPRDVFYIKSRKATSELQSLLGKSGVYILYKDFDVFYIGQGRKPALST